MADALTELEDALAVSGALPTPMPVPTPVATPTPMATPRDPSLLRKLPEEALSISGSIIGGTAGTVLGGPVGGILGGALGSYADVVPQTIFDYLDQSGITPSQRLQQATEEAELGAAVETGMRLLPPALRFGSKLVRGLGSLYRGYIGPATKRAAQELVGAELPSVIKVDDLVRAQQQKEALVKQGVPATRLTTADVTGSQQLAMTEELLSRQPAGNANVELQNLAKNQLQDIDAAAKGLSNLSDPDPVKAGNAVQSLLLGKKESQRQAASKLFELPEVSSLPVETKGLGTAAKQSYEKWLGEAGKLGADAPPSKLNNIYETILKLDEPAPKTTKQPAGFGRVAEAPKEPLQEKTVGTLQSLRSNLLEEARRLPQGSNDWALALDLADELDNRINAVDGTKALQTARAAWKEYKETWYRTQKKNIAPLAQVLKEEAPEKVMQKISANSAVSSAYARVLGVNEPIKLANEMQSFVKLKTVDQKLKWIDDNKVLYSGTPLEETLNGWKKVLDKIASKQEAGAVKALSPENINFEANALIRALGGASKEATASAAEAATKQVALNSARGMLTKSVPTLAAGLTGGVLGLTTGGPVGALLGGGLLAGLEFARGKAVQTGTELTAQALTKALSDPATAMQFIQQAGERTIKDLQEKAAAKAILEQRIQSLNRAAPQLAAVTRGAGIFEPTATAPGPMPVSAPTPEPLAESSLNELESALSSLDELEQALAEQTPQAVTIGKQNVSIPQGEGYAPPELVKAVIQVESAGKPTAVSRKGAAGLMQLMPSTARDLGIEDRFDPEQNVEGGSRYLAKQIQEFGSKELGLAAYNWGPEKIKRAMAKLKAEGKRPTWANVKAMVKVPKETREYVNKVLELI